MSKMYYSFVMFAVALLVVLPVVAAQADTIGFWQFNEKAPGQQTTGAADEIIDSSGNGYHGYAVGNPLPSYVVGQLNPPSAIALTSTGVNYSPNEDRIVVPHNDAFNFNLGAGDDYTLEAIIRTTEAIGTIVTKRASTGPGYNMAFTTGGKITAYVQGTYDFVNPRPEGVTNVADGEWHHVAVVVDADASTPNNNVVKIYVDWVLDATVLLTDCSHYGTPIAEDLSNTHDIWIGDFGGKASHQFVGDIDVVRISSGALTPSEFIQPIPEPTSLVLLFTGLIGLLCYAWRKRK